MAFIYCADVYCNACGRAIRERLRRAGKVPEHPEDESTYDSDEYPKRAGDDEESDTPEHCAEGARCLNAIELPDGSKVGYLFGELTAVGVEYVKDAIRQAELGDGSREVTALWRQHFADKGYAI